METVIQETIDYTRQRKVFGRPVLHNQTVHFRLAELATEVELLRSLLHRAVGEPPHLLPRCASLHAKYLVRLKEHGEMTSRVTDFLCLLFLLALYVEGNDVTKFASMAKLKAGRLTREVADSCLQFWGGMGFTSEVFVSRFYR